MTNGEAVADEAGLRYIRDGEPGYLRRRRGKGFAHIAPDGG